MLILCILGVTMGDQCDMSTSMRTDCGWMGIDQAKCEAKQCCWKPAFLLSNTNDIPWCFYPQGSNPCENMTFDWADGPGFDQSFYDKMNALFEQNINIHGKGGVVASPDPNTPGGSYYYHWMRDGALTMRTYMELNGKQLSKIEETMKAYVGWVQKVQAETDPNGFDIRINPKF
eukprot:GHVR01148574.1.p1 GENE.GHVR01148574.1~~GHVR01148574.1.p1  ORF type:complete len:174 (+),score=21.12 GHVR01148574.1:731-1252(+)